MPNINDLLLPEWLYSQSANTKCQLIAFLVQHRKQKIPSPALLNQMTINFVKNIKQYATSL
ncbi:MAG: hypothetical protein B6I32_06435, partial [Desulfobacterium sp. 4572_20]